MALTRVGGAVKSDRIFDTVAAMVASKTVKVGDIVETAGYTTVNDGGGAKYEIVAADTGTDDGGSFIDLDTHQAKLIVNSDTSFLVYGPDTTGAASVDTKSDSYISLMTGKGYVCKYPAGIYKFDATISVPADGHLIGDGVDNTVFQLDMGSTAGIQLGVGCTLEKISTTSVAYPSASITDSTNYSLSSRRLDISNDCTVRDVKWTNAGGGLNAGSSVVRAHIENFFFDYIRERNGQGAGYHITGGTNIHAYNLNGDHSDRGCEIEDGAVSCSVNGGKMRRIYPDGYTGQPGGYATSSFVLNAHAHESTNGVKNIVFRDMEVEDCLLSIDCQRSTGTSTTDMPQNIVWENIRVLSPRTTGAVPNPIYIEGVNCRLTNIVFEGTAIDSTYGPLIKIFGSDSRGCVVENVEIGQKYNGTAVRIEADYTTLRNMSIEDQTGTATVEDLVDITGDHVVVEDCNFVTPESARTFIRYRNGADYGHCTRNTFTHPSVNDVSTCAVQIEGEKCKVYDNTATSTLASVFCKLTPNASFDGAERCQVIDNNIDYGAAANVIELEANSQRNLVTGNITGSNTQVILDSGTDNTVTHNKRGNVFS